MAIILFLIILAILILSHELGHFSVAKLFGIRVDEFGFGFPPKLFSFKKGETIYSFNLLPLGGFVKIFGEDPTDEVVDKSHQDFNRSLYHKPRYIQFAVIVAGVLFNLILAWIALSQGFMLGLPVPAGFTSFGPRPEDSKLIITEVLKGSPAEMAGLKPGYNIVSLSVKSISVRTQSPEDVSYFISSHSGQDISIEYKTPSKTGMLIDIGLGPLDYDTELKTSVVRPESEVVADRPAIGIAMDQVGVLKLPFFQAIYAGALGVISLFISTVSGFLNFLADLLAGAHISASISGPIGLIGIVSSAADFGYAYLLALVALISVNLAVLNLVPFPALDGGRLFFVIIESIIRKPLNSKVINALNIAGFIFLLGLMLFVTYSDVLNLFDK